MRFASSPKSILHLLAASMLAGSFVSSACADADDLSLLRQDADDASYYEPGTIRRTGQFVLVWIDTLKHGIKHSEYLTEFDCDKAQYRQVALRVITADGKVTSGDAIYKQWFDVPNTSQVLGLAFTNVCVNGRRSNTSLERTREG